MIRSRGEFQLRMGLTPITLDHTYRQGPVKSPGRGVRISRGISVQPLEPHTVRT